MSIYDRASAKLVKHWQKVANTNNKFALLLFVRLIRCSENLPVNEICIRGRGGATASSHKGIYSLLTIPIYVIVTKIERNN